MMDADNEFKVQKYEHFLNETLREDLKKLEKKREDVGLQLVEISQLKDVFKLWSISDSSRPVTKAQVDLGCNFYVNCIVSSTKTVMIYAGLGFYVELSIEEAMEFLLKKEKLLTEESNYLAKESHKVKAHIAVVMKALLELQQLPENLDQETRSTEFDI